ncbi:MAG: hypothetical protein WCQ95_12285 [Bacteroidota bacterium]
MKHLFLFVFIVLSSLANAQNVQINADENQQAYVFNQNKQNANEPQQINFYNTQQAFVPKQQGQTPVALASNSHSFGSSGFSSRTAKTKMHSSSKHASSKFFDKIFEKKYKTVPHYKKKSRFKKCAFFG